jgi:calcineurin-like phosphoesterase
LGREVEPVVWKFRTGLPTRFPVAGGEVRLCGVIVEVDESTGKAAGVERFSFLTSRKNP